MRYIAHTKQSYKNPHFACDILNKFYGNKTIQMYDTTMFGLSSYNDCTMQTGIEGYDLVAHVYKYHKYIPDSMELFEFLLNSDIDINMTDRTNKGSVFVQLIMNNELKWLSKYMSSRWFDDSIIGNVYLFGNTNLTPLQYTIKNQQLPMFNILMQHGAIPYSGIEADLTHFRISSTVKLRELVNAFKLLGITDPIEKIFGIYLKNYELNPQINNYFMKQKFDINYLIDDKNYLIILMSYKHPALITELVTWMLQTGININYVDSSGHDVVHYVVKQVNIDVLIILINAGITINNPLEILINIAKSTGIVSIELLEVMIPKLSKEDASNILNNLAEIYVRKTYSQYINHNIFDTFGFDANIIKTLRNAKVKEEIERKEQKRIAYEAHIAKQIFRKMNKPRSEERARRHQELLAQHQINKAARLAKLREQEIDSE